MRLLLPLLLISGFSFGQAPVIEWQKSLGGTNNDWAQSIKQTTDGGYIVAGKTESNDGDVTANNGLEDFWIVKLDATANITWQKSLGGSNNDWAWSIEQTSDGGYIVAGESRSNDGDVTGFNGGSDYWIVKLDASGNIAWEKSIGGSWYEFARSIQQTTDGGFIIAGGSDSNDGDVSGNTGSTDYWVVKLNANGNITWQKSLGGTGYDEAFDIQQTTDGGYIVVGYSDSNNGDVTGNNGGEDCWVVKLDPSGNITWQKSLGGSSNERAYSVQQSSDGGYIVTGHSQSSDGDVTNNYGDSDCWVVKLDPSGNITWQKSLGGTSFDNSYSIQQSTDGGYIVAGRTISNDGDVTGNNGSSDYWVVKLDGSGIISWQKSIGGSASDRAFSIEQTADGGYIIGGLASSNNGDVTGNNGSVDYWLVKLGSEAFLYELNSEEKELVKVINLLGQETEYKTNTPLIIIYSDGSSERVVKLEE